MSQEQPPLPFEPASEAENLARLPEALLPLINIKSIVEDGEPPPSKFRRHVLDFPNGVRLIASRDHDGDPKAFWIHFSFSVAPSFMSLYTPTTLFETFRDMSIRLGRVKPPSHWLQADSKGVIHFFWQQPVLPRRGCG